MALSNGTFVVKKEVFLHHYGKSYAGIRIGSRNYEAGLFSEVRGTKSADRGIASIGVVFAFDSLCAADCVEVGETVVVKSDKFSENAYISFNGKTFRSTELVSYPELYAAIIAWCTSNSRTESWAEECRSLVKAIVKLGKSGRMEEAVGKLWTFCDNFYYGFCCSQEQVEVEMESLTLSSAQMAFSTAEAHHPIFNKGAVESDEVSGDEKSSFNKFFDDCKAGQYVVAYDWPEECQRYILPLSFLDSFAPNELFGELVKRTYDAMSKTAEEIEAESVDLRIAISRLPQPVLAGTPGTGKTKTLMAVAAALGIPVYSVPVTATTEADTFWGMNGIDNEGKLTKIVTDFLAWHRYGGLGIIEEANLASENLLTGILNQETEAPYFLTEFGYNKTFRHPMAMLSLTMNPDTYGTGRLNQAFASRQTEFNILVNPEQETFVEQTMAQYGDRWSRKQIKFAFHLMSKTIDFLCSIENNAEEIAQAVTPRLAVNFLKQCDVTDIHRAIDKTFVGIVALYDAELSRQLKSVFRDTMNLRYPK